MNDQIYPVNQIESKEIDNLLDPETGELLDEKAAESFLAEKQTEQKAKTLINKAKLEQAAIKVIEEEIENLKRFKEIRKNRVKSIKWFLLTFMRVIGKKKLEFDTVRATRVMNAGRVEIDPDANVDRFKTPVITERVDKTAIKAELQNGKKIKGCRIVKEERVDIK